ncbi:MAG: YidC/Oxa1 family membrane protein insertase [Gammaproteobacteria bacterium]|jgi:YidC/Oxa1 family membrane protein insertase
METTRFILLIALGLVLTMIWQSWHEDYGDLSVQTEVSQQQTLEPAVGRNVEDLPIPPTYASNSEPPSLVVDKNAQEFLNGDVVHVKTDLLDLEINTRGGTIQHLELLNYPLSKKQQDEKVVLLDNDNEYFYIVQGGLLSKNDVANHKTVFTTQNNSYSLAGNDSVSVPLYWESDNGLKVIKTFTFYKGEYIAEINYEIQNGTDADWNGSLYGQINRTEAKEKGSRFIYTYTGAVISSPEKRYEKIDFGDIEDDKLSIDITNGWVAMLQHYFITALVPSSKEEQYHYYTLNPENNSYVIGAISPSKTIGINNSENLSHRVYFGPKLQKQLEQVAEGLNLTVDFGIFWFLAKPLYWVLDYIHGFTNNWGWAIILVTLFLKICFYKLSAAGYRSMANMRRVQPRLLSIKERYKDDRARLNQAMMDIYKEEKINPLGGCFPILIQIPVFISLYWVLLESVELRQADFILWIHDLSIPDPYFVLPLLMGITMFIQQKLNPAPMDPVQAKVMSVLPVVFTVFFAFFPSGLVLYWVVNNTLSIAQQWMITRNIENAASNK